MEERLNIFDKRGIPMAEVEAEVHVQWAMGEIGSLDFTLSKLDNKYRKQYLQFGNFVLYETAVSPTDRSVLLPPWGGVIWPVEKWPRGSVGVHAVSAEFQFKRRIVTLEGQTDVVGKKFTGTRPSLFARLIEIGNEEADMRIEPGSMFTALGNSSVEMRQQSLWDALKELEEGSGEEWWLDPEQDASNRLSFRAHWAVRRGRPRNFDLVEGKNLQLVGEPTRSGELVNRVFVIGEGETNQPYATAVDLASQAAYGATIATEYMETADQSILENRAKELLAEKSQPRISYEAVVSDTDAFKVIRLGDSYPITLESVGFGNEPLRSRVVGMEFKSGEDSLSLALEQAFEVVE